MATLVLDPAPAVLSGVIELGAAEPAREIVWP
jgi:hypothetical protein